MSDVMGWFRRRFRFLGGIAGAVSYADTGPYAGAPRNPDLRVDDEKTYSTIRHRVAHTTITTTGRCRRCGRPSAETHEIGPADDPDAVGPLGTVRTCRSCRTGSWLWESRMPTVGRARDTARKHVV